MKVAKAETPKSLKDGNLKILGIALIIDLLVELWILKLGFSSFSTMLTVAKAVLALSSVVGLFALVLSSIIPPEYKAVLVFWRIKNPLPGSRAFSKYAPLDPRIDLEKLGEHVGEFPEDAAAQNTKWFSLYLLVSSEPSVIDSHKNFLLFRDFATMSFFLLLITPCILFYMAICRCEVSITVLFLLTQYFIVAWISRIKGVSMVKNVLAIHASRKLSP